MKHDLSNIVKSVQAVVKKYSPEILTGIGIAGMVTTTVTAVRATPKALTLIEKRKSELETDQLDKKEIVKTVWYCYIPPTIIGSVSILCLVGASSTNLRRNAALATAYTLSESTLREYQEKIVNSIGEKKEKKIRESLVEEKVVNDPIRDVILTETGGNTVCYDVISGRYFKSDRDTINRIVNDLNRKMRDEMYITLNEFYYELGLDEIRIGSDLGWHIDNGYIDIDFSSHLSANGIPCLVMDYRVAPVYNYRSW